MALANLFDDLGLDGTLQKMAVALTEIAQNIGKWYPNSSGQMPVTVTGTLSTVSTVSTVSAVTSVSQMSGYSTAYDQYCQIQIPANGVRSQITTS